MRRCFEVLEVGDNREGRGVDPDNIEGRGKEMSLLRSLHRRG